MLPAAVSWRRFARTERPVARLLTTACTVGLLAGCGTAAQPPPLLLGSPGGYLLTLDQLVTPDFTVDVPVHSLSIADVAANDPGRTKLLGAGAYSGGAAVEFFRQAASITLVNGPLQVRDQCEQFGDGAAAAALFGDDAARLDAGPGATPISTGPLGDAAHATTRLVTDPASGVRLVEIILEWRVENLLNVLAVRGRDGGTRLDDALVLAHRQTATELGLVTPLPRASPTASAAPGPP